MEDLAPSDRWPGCLRQRYRVCGLTMKWPSSQRQRGSCTPFLVFARSLKAEVIIVEVDRTDNALEHEVDNGIQQRQTNNTDENLLEPDMKKKAIRTGQSCLFMYMRVQAVEIHRAIQTSCTPPSGRASQSRIMKVSIGRPFPLLYPWTSSPSNREDLAISRLGLQGPAGRLDV